MFSEIVFIFSSIVLVLSEWERVILLRNYEIIKASDYIVFYVNEEQEGGALSAYKYAKKLMVLRNAQSEIFRFAAIFSGKKGFKSLSEKKKRHSTA